jgi:hypothetical protein
VERGSCRQANASLPTKHARRQVTHNKETMCRSRS